MLLKCRCRCRCCCHRRIMRRQSREALACIFQAVIVVRFDKRSQSIQAIIDGLHPIYSDISYRPFKHEAHVTLTLFLSLLPLLLLLAWIRQNILRRIVEWISLFRKKLTLANTHHLLGCATVSLPFFEARKLHHTLCERLSVFPDYGPPGIEVEMLCARYGKQIRRCSACGERE